MRRTHCVVYTAVVAAMYSTSHVDNAWMRYLIEIQETGALLKRCMFPVIDFLSVVEPATSDSVYVNSLEFRGGLGSG